jgi:hypothetical protein
LRLECTTRRGEGRTHDGHGSQHGDALPEATSGLGASGSDETETSGTTTLVAGLAVTEGTVDATYAGKATFETGAEARSV